MAVKIFRLVSHCFPSKCNVKIWGQGGIKEKGQDSGNVKVL